MMKEVELGNVCHFENGDRGKNYPSQSAFVEIGIPFISAKDLENNLIKHDNLNYISEETYNKLGSGKLQPNDILFCLRGSLGKFAINKDGLKGGIASSLVLLRAKEDLQINYLKHYLNSPRMKRLITKSDNGSSQPNLSGANVKKFPIPLPPLDQQKKIAAILDAADAYRQKTKALITKYDELTQSLFLDMFGDPVANPNGWESSKLGLIVENKDSKRKPVKSSDRENMDGDYPYYGASGIIDYVNWFTHEGDNLLIGEDGANLLARSKPIAFIAKGQYWVNNHAHVLGCNGKALLVFIEFFINLIDLSNYVTGSAQPKLNRKNMDQIKIFCPPIELQNQFAERVKAIEAQKAQAQASLAQAEDLFNSLLQRAFKGELTS